MKRVLGSIVFALLLIKTAIAADLPVKAQPYNWPSFSWTGIYIGAGGGYGAGQLQGGVGSVTLGINVQSNLPVVFALEADISFSDLKKNTACAAGNCNFNNRWIETTRGRVGYMIDHTLLFATAGFAVGEINANGIIGSESSTKFGYVIGGGLEYDLANKFDIRGWSLRGDYLHIDFGNVSCTVCSAVPVSFRASSDIFRIGISYRFFEKEITELFSARGPPIRPPPFDD